MLATMTTFGGWASDKDFLRAITLPGLALAVPLLDLALTTFYRYRSGRVSTLREAIVFCGRDHTGHRLVALGLGVRRTALFLYLTAGFCGVPILFAHDIPLAAFAGVLVAVCGWLALLAVVLARAPLDPHVIARTASYGNPSPPQPGGPQKEGAQGQEGEDALDPDTFPFRPRGNGQHRRGVG
jgi:hypothetical protein